MNHTRAANVTTGLERRLRGLFAPEECLVIAIAGYT